MVTFDQFLEYADRAAKNPRVDSEHVYLQLNDNGPYAWISKDMSVFLPRDGFFMGDPQANRVGLPAAGHGHVCVPWGGLCGLFTVPVSRRGPSRVSIAAGALVALWRKTTMMGAATLWPCSRVRRAALCGADFPGSHRAPHTTGPRALSAGAKRYVLLPPGECELLYLYPRGHPEARHSKMDWSQLDFEKYPLMKEAK